MVPLETYVGASGRGVFIGCGCVGVVTSLFTFSAGFLAVVSFFALLSSRVSRWFRSPRGGFVVFVSLVTRSVSVSVVSRRFRFLAWRIESFRDRYLKTPMF